eukprot:2038831-Lingulodinium_polyedra.AAC.1
MLNPWAQDWPRRVSLPWANTLLPSGQSRPPRRLQAETTRSRGFAPARQDGPPPHSNSEDLGDFANVAPG